MLRSAESYAQLVERFRWELPERYNIGVDVCDKWAEAEPDRLALIHKAPDGAVVEYRFGEIRRLSNQLANLLAARGVAPGDRVAVLLAQAPETAYGHVAIAKLGAIAVPLFTLFGPEALAYRLRDSGAAAVITDSEGAGKLATLREGLPALRWVLTVDGPHEGCLDLAAELAGQSAHFEPRDTAAEEPALLIYTSGTTGPPKGALHAQRVLLGHLPGVQMSHDLLPQPGDRFWTPADWAWIGGLYDVLMPAWHFGIAVVSHRFRKFDPEQAFQLMADFGVRNAFLPPTALKMMRTVERPRARWDYRLRSIASGGESLGAELLAWGREVFDLDINEFYGQTECNMLVSSCAAVMEPRVGFMGRAVPGHRLAIVDERGEAVADGQLGSIAVKRPDPVMFLRYWNAPEATRDKFRGDWLITGDMGVREPDGFLRFVGRDDDVITSAGYRIGPGEIEDCLLGHPAVEMAGVVGVPDEARTEIIKACIVLAGGFEPSEDLVRDIQRHVKLRLAAHEYPRAIEFVSSLPMTTTGKIVRRALREGRRA